jgi:23S rRNA pseudouridine1911/1915/1917 synthase
MVYTRYENDWFYYIWKPHNIATTFGDQPSFLEELIKNKWSEIRQLQENRSQAGEIYFHAIQELGLINRLDNQTAGLLFFSKNQNIFDIYKTLQNEGKVDKVYYADLHGQLDISKFKSAKISFEIREGKINISSPIYHHKSIPTKMTLDKKHQRGKAHEVETLIEPLYYNSQTNSTTCKILIKKGIRHQIRIHTASMGHPVVGDKLYCPKTLRSEYTKSNTMHLRSVGIEIKK